MKTHRFLIGLFLISFAANSFVYSQSVTEEYIFEGLYAILSSNGTEAVVMESTIYPQNFNNKYNLGYKGNYLRLRLSTSEYSREMDKVIIRSIRVFNERSVLQGYIQDTSSIVEYFNQNTTPAYVDLYGNGTIYIEYDIYNTNINSGFNFPRSSGQIIISCINGRDPPIVSITCSTPDYTNAPSVTLTASISSPIPLDPFSLECLVNSGNVYSSTSVTLQNEGSYFVTFKVKNIFGYEGWASKYIVIDRQPPVVAFPSGWFPRSLGSLKITAMDTGTGVNEHSWQYSLDRGGTWTGASEANSYINLNWEGFKEIFIRVFDNVGNGILVMGQIGVDGTPPVISISGDNLAAWHNSPVTYQVSATDALSGMASLEFSDNGGATYRTESTFSPTITWSVDGEFSHIFRARDAVGNTATASATVRVDTLGPVISNLVFPTGWAKPDHVFSGITILDSTAVSPKVSGVNPTTITISVSGKAATAVTSGYNASTGALNLFTLPGLSDGSQTLTMTARDNVGNLGSVTVEVRIDSVPPQFAAGSDGPVKWLNGVCSVPIRMTNIIEEHSGVNNAAWKYRLDNGTLQNFSAVPVTNDYTASIALGALPAGTHSLTIYCVDNAGNETPSTFSFEIDSIPPDIAYSPLFRENPDELVWVNGSSFEVDATDNDSGIRDFNAQIMRYENDQWAITGDGRLFDNHIVFTPNTPDGLFQILLQARDYAGNIRELTVYLKLDREEPAISFPVGIIGSQWITATATDQLSGLDDASWEWCVNAGIWRAGNRALLAEGKNQQLSFRVRDYAGNLSEKIGEITVDLSPPDVSAIVPPFAYQNRLVILPSASDSITSVTKIWYEVDQENPVVITEWPIGDVGIDASQLIEGKHSIAVKAVDSAGNIGTSPTYIFIVDRTVPEIDLPVVSVISNTGITKTLTDFDFTAVEIIALKAVGEDFYFSDGKKEQGSILYWYWFITKDIQETPLFDAVRRSAQLEFTLTGIPEGVNYLYLCAEDAGGNFSTPVRRIITMDRTLPGTPGIASTTHQEALIPEQATPVSIAEFQFRSAFMIESGITDYQWEVSTVRIANGVEEDPKPVLSGTMGGSGEIAENSYSGSMAEDGNGRLTLRLQDNRAYEFYRLSVQCIAGNGLAGAVGTYQFRIDATPPEDIFVYALPQVDENLWYNHSYASILWNKPADTTGIQDYRYVVSTDKNWQAPDENALPLYDLSDWQRAITPGLDLNIRELLAGDLSGLITLGVCATDYAGNRKLGLGTIQVDLNPPHFAGNQGLAIEDAVVSAGSGKRISWGKLEDTESGVSHIALIVIGTDSVRSFILPPETQDYTIDRLFENEQYTIQVLGYDRAGNLAELNNVCVTGTIPLPNSYIVPYYENNYGLILSGKRIVHVSSSPGTGSIEDEFEDLVIEFPGSLTILGRDNSDSGSEKKPISHIVLSDVTVRDNKPYSGITHGDYTIESEGFLVEGNWIYYERDQGITLHESTYSRPIQISSGSVFHPIPIGAVHVGIPSLFRFTSDRGILNEEATIETIDTRLASGLFGPDPGFALEMVESMELKSGNEWLYGSAITVNIASLIERGIVFNSPDQSIELPISNSALDSNSRNLAGTLSEHPIATVQDVDYIIRYAGVHGGSLEIYEAVLPFYRNAATNEFDKNELIVQNFFLNSTGDLVTMGVDFNFDTLEGVNPFGESFAITGIEFDPSGRLYASLQINSSVYGLLHLTQVLITNNGIDWGQGTTLMNFTGKVHGFSISADRAFFNGEIISIDSGEIVLYGIPRRFTGLVLGNTTGDNILAPGTIIDSYEMDLAYGDIITLLEGTIAAQGVFARMAVPLGDTVSGATVSWEFPEIKLEVNGEMSGCLPGEYAIRVSNFPSLAKDIEFYRIPNSNTGISIGTIVVDKVPGIDQTNMNFSGFSFNAQEVIAEGIYSAPITYLLDGWEFLYDALHLDSNGLSGSGALSLPAELGAEKLLFSKTILSANGDFISGKLGSYANTLLVTGVPVMIPDAELIRSADGYVLYCPMPIVSIESLQSVSSKALQFGETVFNAQGIALRGEKGYAGTRFVSANGYLIDAVAGFIDSVGIWLTGTIGASWWGDAKMVGATGKGIQLLPELNACGTSVGSLIDYAYNGWSIAAEGFTFALHGLEISSNKVKFRGIEIELGTALYAAAGILQDVIQIDQSLLLPLTSWDGVELVETRFSAQGLTARCLVTIPSQFGSHVLDFKSIVLEPTGNFAIALAIPEASFSIGNFMVTFKNISLDSMGITVETAELILPSSMEDNRITLHGLYIRSDRMGLENAQIDPLFLWGMVFHLHSCVFANNEFSLAGALELPSSMPGGLANAMLTIRSFRAGTNGEILSFDAQLNETYTIQFSSAWFLTFSHLCLDYQSNQPWILLNNAALIFPETYKVQDVQLEQVRFNPLSGDFDFDSMVFNTNIHLLNGGIDFTLTKLWIYPQRSIGFSGFAQLPTQGMIPVLAGRTLMVDMFEFLADGSLGSIVVHSDELEGILFPWQNTLELKNGSVSLEKHTDQSVIISLAGDIFFTTAMPDRMGGSSLSIRSLVIDASIPAILQFSARGTIPDLVLFGNRFINITADIQWDSSAQDGAVALSGGIVFPSTFPAFLANKTIEIQNCVIGFDGHVRAIEGSYKTEKGIYYDAFGLIQVSDIDCYLSLQNNAFQYGLAGTLLLPEGRFPSGLGGLTTSVSMDFDNQSGLKSFSASTIINEGKLYGALGMNGVRIDFRKSESSDVQIDISGNFTLLDTMPEGIRGMTIHINRFAMSSTGALLALDVGVSGINSSIFGIVALSNGAIALRQGGIDELIICVSGTVSLTSTNLPQEIRSRSLIIDTFEISTKYGVQSFRVGSELGISFPILGGVIVNVQSLFLSESGVSVRAGVRLPASYPKGLANMAFELTSFMLGWDGRILDIQGGLQFMYFELAGFAASIDSLYFEKDSTGQYWVTLRSCYLILPEYFGSMGGQSIGIKNAKFNPQDGRFLGDIEVPRIYVEVSGFGIELSNPTIEFSKEQIYFSSATLMLPSFMPLRAISIYGVTLSAKDGFKLQNGVGIALPDFKIRTLSFTNVRAEFKLAGSDFLILGEGYVSSQNIGMIGAKIVFGNATPVYPIGLRQADFTFKMAGGIPLADSGLYLYGGNGGLAYGPPTDVPAKLQGIFNQEGPRVKAGVFIGDQYGGRTLEINPVIWIDISNGQTGFQGDVIFLRDEFNIAARFTGAVVWPGVYGGLNIDLLIARGGLDLYLWDRSGNVGFAGEGYVQLGLPKGRILDRSVLGIRVRVPDKDIWLPSINADFGRFNESKLGFKGYVNLPILDHQGVFVGKGVFEIGNVQSYRLEKPNWAATGLIGSQRMSLSGPGSVLGGNLGVDETETVTYTVSIPQGRASVQAEDRLEKIVALLAYIEGDPVLQAVSPSGVVYCDGDGNTDTVLLENVLALIIHNPEPGLWTFHVSGIGEDFFDLSVLGSERVPTLTVQEPSMIELPVTDEFVVKGVAEIPGSPVAIYGQHKESGMRFELGTAQANARGEFELYAIVFDVPDGVYEIYAELAGDIQSPRSYAPGTIYVDRRNSSFCEPEPVWAAETDPGTVTLRWQNTNGGMTAGYQVKIRDLDTEQETSFYVGNITVLTIPGYDLGRRLSFAVASVDSYNQESAYSSPVFLHIGAEKPLINRPTYASGVIPVLGEVGGTLRGIVHTEILQYQKTEDPFGYIIARQTGGSENGTLYFGDRVKIDGENVEIPWTLRIPEDALPGEYTCGFELINEGNGTLRVSVEMHLSIRWPNPEIETLYPNEIMGTKEQVLAIEGRGFVPGTQVFFQGKELLVVGTPLYRTMTVRIPLQEASGAYPVIIRGPGGETTSHPLTVALPGWQAVCYVSEGETVPGGTVDYWIGIRGHDGFSGMAQPRVLSAPDSWDVAIPAIPVDATGAIRITVPENAAPGTYSTRISGGSAQVLELRTTVRDDPVAPYLSYCNPPSQYPGGEVRLYGYSLGQGGQLYLNNALVPVRSWSESEIVFTLPDYAMSGEIRAETAKGYTNSVAFRVREQGFTLHLQDKALTARAGETVHTALALTGYSDEVTLQAIHDPAAPFSIALASVGALANSGISSLIIRPNAFIDVAVIVDDNAPNGSWFVTINGSSSGYETLAMLQVSIQDSLAIVEKELPQGITGVFYRAELSCANGDATQISYQVIQGELPPGLTLSRDGIISGRPRNQGQYALAIEARESNFKGGEWRSVGNFIMIIRDDAWGQAGKDGGHSFAGGTDLPGESAVFRFTPDSPPLSVLAAENRLVLISSESIVGVSVQTGQREWSIQATEDADYSEQGWEIKYAGRWLYLLDPAGNLEARDMNSGALLWTRGAIEHFYTNGSLIIAEAHSDYLIVDGYSGALKEIIAKEPMPDALVNSIVWMQDCAFLVSATGIRGLYGSNRIFSLGMREERINTVSADALGMAVCAGNSLILLDRELNEIGCLTEVTTGPFHLALAEDAVLVLDYRGLTEYSRETLLLRYSCPATSEYPQQIPGWERGAFLAVGRDKAVCGDSNGVWVVNRYTGSLVWNEPYSEENRTISDLVLYQERIYAADSQGVVSIYNGRVNPQGPTVEIVLEPDEPSMYGWHNTNPSMTIQVFDRESYVASLYVTINGEDFIPEQSGYVLEDGEYEIRAYGVDSHGLKGAEVRRIVRVDATPPESEYALFAEIDGDAIPRNPLSEDEWVNTPLLVVINAWDEGSSVESIWTSQSSLRDYSRRDTETIRLETPGVHQLSWYALDLAGNREEMNTLEARLDFEPPWVDCSVSQDGGVLLLSLTAADPGSGLGSIEYRFDDGEIALYQEPIVITSGEYAVLYYRAKDRALNYSLWQEQTLPTGIPLTEIIESPQLDMANRLALALAHNGIAGVQNTPAAVLRNLPTYLLGAEYILWEEQDHLRDESSRISFSLLRDAVLYLLYPREADGQILEEQGWSLVEEYRQVNAQFFPSGARVYMKRGSAGSRIVVNGTGMGVSLPFIAAQEWGSIYGDIEIRLAGPTSESAMPSGFLEAAPGSVLSLHCVPGPWRYSRRLPLRNRWFVYEGDGWEALDDEEYTIPETVDGGFLRFRVELSTPDGQIEYRTEKSIALLIKE